MQKKSFLFLLLICLFLTACSQDSLLRKRVRTWDPYQYRVQNGDTLYSIAWRYDLDHKSIAIWNKIKPPYLIYVGQKLKLKGPDIPIENKTYLFAPSISEQTKPIVAQPAPDYSIPNNVPAPPPLNSASVNKKAYVPPAKHPKSTLVKKSTNIKQNIEKPVKYPKNNEKFTWSWPINGKVITTYAANNHDRKGIDIQGKAGQKIKAAANGVVVYSGSGLISYGNLIIIKHNDRFLSAYAYNKKLLVNEGAEVNKGETIAIIGKNLNVTNLLHFEIRKDGKPVNPLVYLP